MPAESRLEIGQPVGLSEQSCGRRSGEPLPSGCRTLPYSPQQKGVYTRFGRDSAEDAAARESVSPFR